MKGRPRVGVGGGPSWRVFGGVLLSHLVSGAVPSALKGLTSGFGMGPGVSPSLWPPKRVSSFGLLCCSRPYLGNCIVDACVWSSPRPISTGQLRTLPFVYFRPINPVVCWGPYQVLSCGSPYLEAGFPLRCFQRLSLPNVANQPCPWQDNWHTRGSSVPVLSY